MRKHVVPWTFSAALFGSLLVLCAVASADDLERTLNQTYRGKVFVLRNFWRGDLLRYDSAGQIIGNATSGFWTTDGLVRVEEVRLTGATLNLECKRMFMVESKDGFDYRERSKKARKREIAIDLGPKPISAELRAQCSRKYLCPGKPISSPKCRIIGSRALKPRYRWKRTNLDFPCIRCATDVNSVPEY